MFAEFMFTGSLVSCHSASGDSDGKRQRIPRQWQSAGGKNACGLFVVAVCQRQQVEARDSVASFAMYHGNCSCCVFVVVVVLVSLSSDTATLHFRRLSHTADLTFDYGILRPEICV